MAGYRTEQRAALEAFFKRNTGRALSAEEIACLLSENGGAPGKSTIYRLLQKMAGEGVIKRYARTGNRGFVYEMTDAHPGCPDHLHLKCVACGRLIHLNPDETERALTSLRAGGFEPDCGRTLILGKCAHCAGEENDAT